jgi:hypothetical protein
MAGRIRKVVEMLTVNMRVWAMNER